MFCFVWLVGWGRKRRRKKERKKERGVVRVGRDEESGFMEMMGERRVDGWRGKGGREGGELVCFDENAM